MQTGEKQHDRIFYYRLLFCLMDSPMIHRRIARMKKSCIGILMIAVMTGPMVSLAAESPNPSNAASPGTVIVLPNSRGPNHNSQSQNNPTAAPVLVSGVTLILKYSTPIQEERSQTLTVDTFGRITLPTGTSVTAAGLTLQQFEAV